jgi:LacI family gluconate utilization system Gnt-I transcriptional repressor
LPKRPRAARPTGLAITLADVAREGGVSEITVSRVIRNKGAISDETRERVEAAIRKVGYVPNRLAGSLASSGSDLVGVIVPTLRSIFPDILRGITEAIAEEGYRAVVGTTEFKREEEERLVSSLLAWRPAAMIVAAFDHSPTTNGLLASARERLVEITDIEREPIGVSLGISHFRAGYETARYVLSRGYRRIGFVGHNIEDDRYALRRHDGFATCLAESGLRFVAENVVNETYDAALGKTALATLLARDPTIDAVYFSNDAMAVGGYFHCMAVGIAVPGKLALVGFNGTDIGQALPRPLTSVLSKRYELGLLAGRSALSLIAGRDVPRVVDVGFDLLRGATA